MSCQWSDDDVLADGVVVGRIFKAAHLMPQLMAIVAADDRPSQSALDEGQSSKNRSSTAVQASALLPNTR
jgi:hypothetical protein